MRRGVVVIHFRPDTDADRLDRLKARQEAVPNEAIRLFRGRFIGTGPQA